MNFAFVAAVICSFLLLVPNGVFGFFWGPKVDPEVNMKTHELIENQGYPAEEHTVETDDGYLIKIHRIPKGRNDFSRGDQKPVIFLQHGVMCDSSNWVSNFPDQSFGFLLADAGFDVWLGNTRGNVYGLGHTTYNYKHSEAFWDFSLEESAKYDLPAMLKYVTKKTSQSSLYYVGHSQGCSLGVIEFSRNAELAKMVKKFYALAPTALFGSAKALPLIVGKSKALIKTMHVILGKRGFALPSTAQYYIATRQCPKKMYIPWCALSIFMICGPDTKGLNKTRLPVYNTHMPAGTSSKNMIHWLQMYNSNKFAKYDYGDQNKDHYNQDHPPLYNVTTEVPVVIYSGENDYLADPVDVNWLVSELPNVVHKPPRRGWNHFDFILGLEAASVYNEIINDIKNPSSTVV